MSDKTLFSKDEFAMIAHGVCHCDFLSLGDEDGGTGPKTDCNICLDWQGAEDALYGPLVVDDRSPESRECVDCGSYCGGTC